MLPSQFYRQDSLTLAQALLGCELVHVSAEGVTAGIIVETEAYHQNDEASHSFRGQTPRNAVMFGEGGVAYVYFTYGVHYCVNVVGGEAGEAEGVLIRALEPTQGLDLMEARRKTVERLNLCSGPGKLVQAMAIGPEDNGKELTSAALHINKRRTEQIEIVASPRIGITRATDKPWRFFIKNNPYVSKHKFNRLAVNL
jgi:DNA-3-methyladenine glycosylase